MRLPLLILGFSLTAFAEKTLLLLEISRHGAREPLHLYNFTKDPNANFNSTGNLLPLGKREHWNLGQSLRQRYLMEQGFLPPVYNPVDIHVESTYTNRTYMSALYQLMGLYPDCYPSKEDIDEFNLCTEDFLSPVQREAALNNFTADPSKVLHVIRRDHATDFLLHTDDYNC